LWRSWVTRLLMDRCVYLAAISGIVGLGAGAQLSSHVIPDTAWYLHLAGRLLDGSRLYADLVEVNPPLIVWLNLAPVWLSRTLGISDVLLYRLGVIGLCLVSVWLCARVLKLVLREEETPLRRLIVLLALFVLLPASRQDFGEREHLMLALAFPYVLLAAARARRVHVPKGLSTAVGLLAGAGIALKPYFLILWLAVEAWLCFGPRVRTLAERVEGLLVAVVGVCYLAGIVLLTPDYLAVARTMAASYYHFLSDSVLVTVLLGDGVAICLFALLGFLALRGSGRHGELWTALAVAAAGFYAAAVLQQKGWRYHFYPSLATGLVLIGVMAADRRRRAGSAAERIYAAAVAAAAVLVPTFIAVASVTQMLDARNPRYDADPDLTRLLPVVREHAKGRPILVLSSNMASSFPLVTYSGAKWASRFPSAWILLAAYQDALSRPEPLVYRPPPRREGLERYLTEAMAAELQREPPELILVLRSGPDRQEFGVRRLDYLRYFRMDERFDRVFREYSLLGDIGQYQIYRRGPSDVPVLPAPAVARAGAAPAHVSVGLEWSIERGTLIQAAVFCLVFGLAYRREQGAMAA